MSNNKKILIKIGFLISALFPLTTSAMQPNSKIISNQIKNISLETLKKFKEIFTKQYGILSEYYNEKKVIKNMEIEKFQDNIKKEEEKYYSFFNEIDEKYNEEYKELNSEIENIITKIKEIITKIKKEEIDKTNNQIKTENRIEEYKDKDIYNISQDIYAIYDNIKEKISNFSKLNNYKKIFSGYNENLSNKNENEIKNKIEEYYSFFEEISKKDDKAYDKINLDIINIITKIKENLNLKKLKEYEKIFSTYNKNFPVRKENDLFLIYYEKNKEEFYKIMNELNEKIQEYKSFFEKIKSENNKQYNKIDKKIRNILSEDIEEDIDFFKKFKNIEITDQMYEIEEELFNLKENMVAIENLFFKEIINNENNKNLDKKELLEKKLNFIEKNYEPIITSYKKYKEEVKEKHKEKPYFFIIEKLFYKYNSVKSIIELNLANILHSMNSTYKTIKKNLNNNEKENYENRIMNIIKKPDDNSDSNSSLNLDIESESSSLESFSDPEFEEFKES